MNDEGHMDASNASDQFVEILYVRHGLTKGLHYRQTTGIREPPPGVTCDDPLNDVGRHQATLFSLDGRHDVVLCSPLERALETCILALDKPANRGLCVRVTADIREMTWHQRAGEPLYWRHVGHKREALEQLQFVRGVKYITLDWSELPYDEIWWDADAQGVCTTDYRDAHWRARLFARRLSALTDTRRVVVFAHESFYRAFCGQLSLEHPPRAAHLVLRRRPLVEPASPHTSRCPVKSLLKPVLPCQTALQDAIVILGCSDLEQIRLRATHAKLLLDSLPSGGLLLFLGSADEFTFFGNLVDEMDFSSEQRRHIYADQCSFTTHCNVDHCLAYLAELHGGDDPWNVSVVTNDWHIPRSMMLFPHQCSFANFLPAAVTGDDSFISQNHLGYGAHLAGMLVGSSAAADVKFEKLWPDLIPELLVMGANMRKYVSSIEKEVRSNETNPLLVALATGDRVLINMVLQTRPYLAHDEASDPLVLAAQQGLLLVVRDLILCWGVRPTAEHLLEHPEVFGRYSSFSS